MATSTARRRKPATKAQERAAEVEVEPLELGERYHAEGCPTEQDRLESYRFEVPDNLSSGRNRGRTGHVVRCVDCGGEKHHFDDEED